MVRIEQDVASYEKWLRKQCDVVKADLEIKHEKMRKSPFGFLRATYFRWARTIEELCPALGSAPRVLCIGDIHIENYGTWRDADARLVWGINDFDEAAVMPYAHDLIRLATSVLLTPEMQTSASDMVEAALEGYRRGLSRPCAVLLDEDSGWLRSYANPTSKSNSGFWQEVAAYPDANPPIEVERSLRKSLPVGAELLRFASRSKGGGSLGRPRFLAIAAWNSGTVVREAKALVPSAWNWAHELTKRNRFLDAASGPYRSPDPHLCIKNNFLLRRIAADSRKIEIGDVHATGLSQELVAAMAAELASVHAASPKANLIPADLAARGPSWLHEATEAAKTALVRDFVDYSAQK